MVLNLHDNGTLVGTYTTQPDLTVAPKALIVGNDLYNLSDVGTLAYEKTDYVNLTTESVSWV